MRKLENWLTYGGLALAVIAFFGVDATAVWRWLGSISGRTAFAIVGITVFAVGLTLKLRERKVRIGNVQRKISQWLRTSMYAVREVDFANWYFGFQITEPGVRMWIARVRGRGFDKYITIIAPIIPFSAEGKKAYDDLSEDKRRDFNRKLMLQIAISKINFADDFTKNSIRLTKRIPISSKLTEADLLNAIVDMTMSATIIWNTIVLELNQKEQVTPPLPTADTEAPPPPKA